MLVLYTPLSLSLPEQNRIQKYTWPPVVTRARDINKEPGCGRTKHEAWFSGAACAWLLLWPQVAAQDIQNTMAHEYQHGFKWQPRPQTSTWLLAVTRIRDFNQGYAPRTRYGPQQQKESGYHHGHSQQSRQLIEAWSSLPLCLIQVYIFLSPASVHHSGCLSAEPWRQGCRGGFLHTHHEDKVAFAHLKWTNMLMSLCVLIPLCWFLWCPWLHWSYHVILFAF